MSRETRCRSCRTERLHPVLSLGDTPLANRLLTHSELADPEPLYPLDVVFCEECTLLQITETVPPEELFREYVYFSSFSDTVVDNAKANVDHVLALKPLGADDLVIEVASNDGYLLQHYRAQGIRVLGIEPASNIARVANERGIETIDEFFGVELARRLRAGNVSASVIHASNVLAHVSDLNGFVSGIEHLLRDDGIAVIEVPYVRDLVDNVEFDTIYHEHLCYFSATALRSLFSRNHLAITRLERIPIHGGTLRVTVLKGEPAEELPILREERAWGVEGVGTYVEFASRIEQLRRDLLSLLRHLRAGGARIAAYGASAKGATLLNHFGIGRDVLEYVVDRSTVKQGRYTPGTHLKIVSPDALRDDAPDYLLLLSWNHAAEILHQQTEYRARGGKFIIPIPAPEIV